MKRKRLLLIILFILITFTLTLSAEEVKFDFRKINWDMNETQVKEIEGNEMLETYEDGFVYVSKNVP
jgi:hypothetical protein